MPATSQVSTTSNNKNKSNAGESKVASNNSSNNNNSNKNELNNSKETNSNNINNKNSIASFKQNPYYSPLYDCDVNYFRYAFSSDSLTIKSAVAIKSIDIKPLKKDEKKPTSTKSNNMNVKSNEINETPTTTSNKSKQEETVKNSTTSTTIPKIVNNSLSKSKSMIANNIISKPLTESALASLKEEKASPSKIQQGAQHLHQQPVKPIQPPTIKKSKSIIALNKKDGSESKFSTVKKSVKFKNENIVVKIDDPNSTKEIQPIKSNDTPTSSTSQINNTVTNNNNSKPSLSINKPISNKAQAKPLNNNNSLKSSEPNKTPSQQAKQTVNQTTTILKSNESNKPAVSNAKSAIITDTIKPITNKLQSTQIESAKSLNNLANLNVKNPVKLEPIKAHSIANGLKPDISQFKTNLSNSVSHSKPATYRPATLTQAKSVENLKILSNNSIATLKPTDTINKSVVNSINQKSVESVKNNIVKETATLKSTIPATKTPEIKTAISVMSPVKPIESISLKNITNLPVFNQISTPTSSTSSNKSVQNKTNSTGAQNTSPSSTNVKPKPVVKTPTPTVNNTSEPKPIPVLKYAETVTRPSNLITNTILKLNKSTPIPLNELIQPPPPAIQLPLHTVDILDYENYPEYDMSEIERSKSPDLTYRLSNLNQEIKLIHRKESANLSLADLSPSTTPPIITPPAVKTKSPTLKSVTFSNVTEEVTIKPLNEPLTPIMVKSNSPIQKVVQVLDKQSVSINEENNKSVEPLSPASITPPLTSNIIPINTPTSNISPSNTPSISPPALSLPTTPTSPVTPLISPKITTDDKQESHEVNFLPELDNNYNKNHTESNETSQQQHQQISIRQMPHEQSSLFQRILQNIDQIDFEGNEYTTKNTYSPKHNHQYKMHDGFFLLSDSNSKSTTYNSIASDKIIIIREKFKNKEQNQRPTTNIINKRLSELIIDDTTNKAKRSSSIKRNTKLDDIKKTPNSPSSSQLEQNKVIESIKQFNPVLNQIKIEEINLDETNKQNNKKKIPIKSKTKPDNNKIKKIMSKIFC